MKNVKETILGVGSGNAYMRLELSDIDVPEYRGKKLSNQQIFDLSPLANCRCRVVNGVIADMCFKHYWDLTIDQQKFVDRMMSQVRAGY